MKTAYGSRAFVKFFACEDRRQPVKLRESRRILLDNSPRNANNANQCLSSALSSRTLNKFFSEKNAAYEDFKRIISGNSDIFSAVALLSR